MNIKWLKIQFIIIFLILYIRKKKESMRNNQIFPRRVEAWKISKFTDFSFPFQYFIYRDTNMRATGSPNARSFRIVIASMDANDNVCSVPNATTYRRYAEFSPRGNGILAIRIASERGCERQRCYDRRYTLCSNLTPNI